MHVAEPERVGAILLVETGEANLRAVAQANPIRPRYTLKVASLPELMKPVTGGGSNEQVQPAGPSGVIGDSAQG
jgi:hypothetical protein